MRIYSILDTKAEVPVNVFTAPNDEAAIRSFEMLLFSPEDSVFNNSPEDFTVAFVMELDPFHGDPNRDVASVIAFGNSYSRAVIQSRREENMRNRISILNAGKEDSANG